MKDSGCRADAARRRHQARLPQRAMGVALTAAAAFLAVACASPGADGGQQARSSPPGTGALGGATSATRTGSTEPAGCLLADLTVTANAGDSGSGHRSVVLVFTNHGSATCRLYGYPGVAALDSHDTQIAQATRTTSGYLGGLGSGRTAPNVDLATGQSASAMVEALAFNANDGSACTAYAGLLVTPPNETRSTKLGWPSDGCSDLQIHPVVPGITGRLS
jgi:Protein of unknown function (DUF4232)